MVLALTHFCTLLCAWLRKAVGGEDVCVFSVILGVRTDWERTSHHTVTAEGRQGRQHTPPCPAPIPALPLRTSHTHTYTHTHTHTHTQPSCTCECIYAHAHTHTYSTPPRHHTHLRAAQWLSNEPHRNTSLFLWRVSMFCLCLCGFPPTVQRHTCFIIT